MKIIYRFFVGAVNMFVFLTIFVNKEFWKTWGNLFNVASYRTIENFTAFATQAFSYVAFGLMIGYCFSNKLRHDEKFWNFGFVINSVGLVAALVLVLAVRFATTYQSGAGGVMVSFILVGLLYAMNVGLLLVTAIKKPVIEDEITNET